ncbi:MAG TPA: ATP-grasp domain-containing protein [Bacillota bacterium]|mgnify:CR=1 FL=1|nr:ATP-grasp domain-containing protein [Bacillota bacterium]
MNVLVEGIGSMVFNTQLKYYKAMNWNLIGIDIDQQSAGWYKVDKAYIVPRYADSNCFNVIEEIIRKEQINLVFPTVNEGLLQWSKRRDQFKALFNTFVILSNEKVVKTCVDKWETYRFFIENGIPTPKTALGPDYDLLKPRTGRGSQGIYLKDELKTGIRLEDYISQELVSGEEYTVDILCDFNSRPVYIIPRKRVGVESGVSVKGQTVYDPIIIDFCKKIVERLKPVGIINIQCFKEGDKIYFIEINPRLAGGASLSFAASDNWFRAIECFLLNKKYEPKEIKFNRSMFRYYEELIVDE